MESQSLLDSPMGTQGRTSSRIKKRPYKVYKSPYYRPQLYKIRLTTGISSDGGGDISAAVTDNPNLYQDWTSLGSLFDSYKVRGMKIQWVPNIPEGADPTSTISYKPLYVYYDPDSTTTVGTVAEAIQYNNMKVKNIYSQWSYYTKVPTRAADGTSKILAGGFVDAGSVNAFSAIHIIGNSFSASSAYGVLIATLYLEMKYRR